MAYSIPEILGMVTDTIVAIAGLLGIFGLWQWRHELIGKRKFEVASRLMMLALQFRDQFRFVRNPGTWANETLERQKATDETPQESQLRDEYFARMKRVQNLQPLLQQLLHASWEAETFLGDDDAKLVVPFEQSFNHLYQSVIVYFEDQLRLLSSSNTQSVLPGPMTRELLYTNIYGSRENDELGADIDGAVTSLKTKLRKYLK